MHISDKQDRPLTSRQVSEDHDHVEQPAPALPAKLPNTNAGPTVELWRSTKIRPVIRYGDVVTY